MVVFREAGLRRQMSDTLGTRRPSERSSMRRRISSAAEASARRATAIYIYRQPCRRQRALHNLSTASFLTATAPTRCRRHNAVATRKQLKQALTRRCTDRFGADSTTNTGYTANTCHCDLSTVSNPGLLFLPSVTCLTTLGINENVSTCKFSLP